MAKMTPNGLSGVVGTVVAYTMKGEEYLRSRPKKKKRKKDEPVLPTRALFGNVSRFGSAMLMHMSKGFSFPFGLKTYNGARGWMRNYFIHHGEGASFSNPPLCCQLNPESDLRDYFPLQVSATYEGGTIAVSIPSFTPLQVIKAPAGTTHVLVKIVATSTKFEEPTRLGKTEVVAVRIEYTNYPLSLLPLKLNMEDRTGHIALVTMALEFEAEGSIVKEKEWLPAAAIGIGKLS